MAEPAKIKCKCGNLLIHKCELIWNICTSCVEELENTDSIIDETDKKDETHVKNNKNT